MLLGCVRNLIRTGAPVALMVFALVVAAPSARADTIGYLLDTGNPPVAAFTGPYVDVLVDRTSATTATITFTSLDNGGETFLIGNGGAAGVNVNATSWSVGSFLGSNAGTGFTSGAISDSGSGNQDGFGVFNQKIDIFDGYTNSVNILSFILTNLSGNWATAADVLIANANGNVAAAHVFVADCGDASLCDAGVGALATGFASVPEPATAAMVTLGLIGLGWMGRRR
jgi:hypothetical protein